MTELVGLAYKKNKDTQGKCCFKKNCCYVDARWTAGSVADANSAVRIAG